VDSRGATVAATWLVCHPCPRERRRAGGGAERGGARCSRKRSTRSWSGPGRPGACWRRDARKTRPTACCCWRAAPTTGRMPAHPKCTRPTRWASTTRHASPTSAGRVSPGGGRSASRAAGTTAAKGRAGLPPSTTRSPSEARRTTTMAGRRMAARGGPGPTCCPTFAGSRTTRTTATPRGTAAAARSRSSGCRSRPGGRSTSRCWRRRWTTAIRGRPTTTRPAPAASVPMPPTDGGTGASRRRAPTSSRRAAGRT